MKIDNEFKRLEAKLVNLMFQFGSMNSRYPELKDARAGDASTSILKY